MKEKDSFICKYLILPRKLPYPPLRQIVPMIGVPVCCYRPFFMKFHLHFINKVRYDKFE